MITSGISGLRLDQKPTHQWSGDPAGHDGPIEVEVLNADIWARDGDAVPTDVIERSQMHVV